MEAGGKECWNGQLVQQKTGFSKSDTYSQKRTKKGELKGRNASE